MACCPHLPGPASCQEAQTDRASLTLHLNLAQEQSPDLHAVHRRLGITREEALQDAAPSAYDLDPEGQDVAGEPRSLLSGEDLSDKDAYGPPAVLLAGFPVEEVAGVSLFFGKLKKNRIIIT